MPGDHSKSFDGPGDNTPFVPTWMQEDADKELLERMIAIDGGYQGRRLHQIIEFPDGTFEANVMEGMQLVGDFGYGSTPGAAIRKALIASGCNL